MGDRTPSAFDPPPWGVTQAFDDDQSARMSHRPKLVGSANSSLANPSLSNPRRPERVSVLVTRTTSGAVVLRPDMTRDDAGPRLSIGEAQDLVAVLKQAIAAAEAIDLDDPHDLSFRIIAGKAP